MLRTVRAPVAILSPIFVIGCSYDFDTYLPTGADDAGIVVSDSAGDGAPPADAQSCSEPNGRVFEGHCYFPLTTAATFDNAQTNCAAARAHLVTITSAAEEAFVETMRAGRERWIGLRRPDGAPGTTASSFAWITGESGAYAKWGRGEPNDSGACARLRSSNDWGDQSCTTSYEAICERD